MEHALGQHKTGRGSRALKLAILELPASAQAYFVKPLEQVKQEIIQGDPEITTFIETKKLEEPITVNEPQEISMF